MFSEEVKRLREIYNKLKKVPNLDKLLIKNSSIIEYETETGICKASVLKSCPQIAIIDSEMGPNTLLKCHQHPKGYELLIVYMSAGTSENTGITVHYLNGRKENVNVNGFVVIGKDVAHIVSCENTIKLIGITVPKDDGYP
jgi:hypothetical protein